MDNFANQFFNSVWTVIAQEFSNASLEDWVRVILRLGLAALLGGLLGYEREHQGKSAGIRTHILVALGSSLLTLTPILYGVENTDTARVIQGIITGIGFLGAGTIIKTNGIDVHGLTTAAGIWVTAAIGLSVGMGQWMPAIVATFIMMIVLTYIKIVVIEKPPPKPTLTESMREDSRP